MFRAKWLIAGALLLLAGQAFGQTVVVERSVVVPVRPEVVYYPPTVSTPVVVNSPPVVRYSSPVVTYSAPVTTVTEPVSPPVEYRVPYTSSYVSAPVTVYPYPSYVVGRGSVGQPTIYVPGQPVRNAFRFFAP